MSSTLGRCGPLARRGGEAGLKTAEQTVDEVPSWQKPNRGATPHAELAKLGSEAFIFRINHHPATQVANRFRAAIKGEIDTGETQVKIGVVELLAHGCPGQFNGTEKLPANQRQGQRIAGSKSSALWVGQIGPAQVLKCIVPVAAFE